MSERRLADPRVLSYITLLGVAVGGWTAVTVGMRRMEPGPAALPRIDEWMAAWVVMLVAMMLPSISRMVSAHASIEAARRRAGQAVGHSTTATFVGGYLTAWTVAGIAAFAVHESLRTLAGHELIGGRWVEGVVLVAAGAYQLTRARCAFLTMCRAPIVFVLRGWRHGTSGALLMGADYGRVCIGCCAPVMVALVALGPTDMTWMALVAAAIAIEKLGPWGRGPTWAIGVALVLVDPAS
jgi:predicted metal-binding membrane protein